MQKENLSIGLEKMQKENVLIFSDEEWFFKIS
jgi:hypothetical protein